MKKSIVFIVGSLSQPRIIRRIESFYNRGYDIKVYGYDDVRVDKSDHDRSVTVKFEDLLTLADAALLECYSCPQGDCVKNCQYRMAFHSLGLNCGAARENPADGECEFRFNNEQKHVTPQYERVDEKIEQIP